MDDFSIEGWIAPVIDTSREALTAPSPDRSQGFPPSSSVGVGNGDSNSSSLRQVIVVTGSGSFVTESERWLASETTWSEAHSIVNSMLPEYHEAPLWYDLTSDQLNLLVRDWYNGYLKCDAQGHNLRFCSSGFLIRRRTLNPKLGRTLGDRLRWESQLRMRTYRIQVASQHHCTKNSNPHALGGLPRGDGYSSFIPVAPPFPPPVSTTGVSSGPV